MGSRVVANLIAIAVVSGALLLYAGTSLLTSVVLDRTYPLSVELANADGLLPDKEVTYNGVGIGQVDAIELTEDGAMVHLRIDRDVRIPAEHDLVVLRSSPVGEQAIDFRPFAEVTDATVFLEAGDLVEPRDVTLPPPIQDLFELANDVFEPLDKAKTGAVISELATAVEGRREDVRAILSDSARFSESIADNGQDYDRLFASSRVVNRALAESRDTLAQFITDSADASSILTDIRTEFEGLLVDAPPTLNQLSDLVEGGQANISCIIDDFASVNAYLALPEQLENASEALRVNQFFFQGFNVITPRSASGDNWQRIHVIVEDDPMPQSFLPAKRPIPDILPGGACSSPFGEGAPSAQQVGYQKFVPEARLVLPADDRATPVRRGAGVRAAESREVADTTPGAAPVRSGDLPATGGALLPVLLGALLMGLASRALRRPGTMTAEDRRGGREQGGTDD